MSPDTLHLLEEVTQEPIRPAHDDCALRGTLGSLAHLGYVTLNSEDHFEITDKGIDLLNAEDERRRERRFNFKAPIKKVGPGEPKPPMTTNSRLRR